MKNSVIIPVYNTGKYLEQCVLSVLNQPGAENIEVILIDDGSTDNSGVLCDELEKKNSQVICVHQKNEGLSSARNKGISVASGEYIFFLDSDDFWSNSIYLEVCKKLEEKSSDILLFSMSSYIPDLPQEIFFDCNLYHDISNLNGQEVLKAYLKRDYSFGWCSVWYAIKRSWLLNNHLFFPKNDLCEDVSFTFKLWIKASSVEFADVDVYNYRRNNTESITHRASYKFSVDLLKMIRSNLLIAAEQISSPELMGLIKLNFQTLVEVVLFWFTSYSRDEQKELENRIFELRDIYEIEPQAKKYMKKKEKIVNATISLIGVRKTAQIWGIKRKLKFK